MRVSGWGQTGPYAQKPGFGTLVEGMSGYAAKTGFPDREPVLPPTALADMVAGLYGAYAVMVALREIETKGGKGQVIDLSLLEPIHSVIGADAAMLQGRGHRPQAPGQPLQHHQPAQRLPAPATTAGSRSPAPCSRWPSGSMPPSACPT